MSKQPKPVCTHCATELRSTEQEEWRDIPGYEGLYRVSSLGRVWSFYNDRLLILNFGARGYYKVALCKDGSRLTVCVHILVALAFFGVKPSTNLRVDHINGITTDNRLSNLRMSTVSQNNYNARRSIRNTSGYKGVCWDKSKQKWMARIRVNKHDKFLGHFDDPADAHEAYKIGAIKYAGEFARFE